MDRRTVLVSTGISLVYTTAGCLTKSEGENHGNGDGDRFPDRVELDVTGKIDSEQKLEVTIELENRVITELKPRESLWVTIVNDDDEPITSRSTAELFPSEFRLRPKEYLPSILLERAAADVEKILAGESASKKYTFALSSDRLDRRFDGSEIIKYDFNGSEKEGEITLIFTAEIILEDEN